MKNRHFSYKRVSTVDALLTAIILGLVTFSVFAEPLRDPTQLPSSIAAANVIDGNGQKQVLQYGTALQSVILSSRNQGAIISGQRVNIGEKFQDARLVSVTENSATLRSANGAIQTLTMQHNDIKQTMRITKSIHKNKINNSTRNVTQRINVR